MNLNWSMACRSLTVENQMSGSQDLSSSDPASEGRSQSTPSQSNSLFELTIFSIFLMLWHLRPWWLGKDYPPPRISWFLEIANRSPDINFTQSKAQTQSSPLWVLIAEPLSIWTNHPGIWQKTTRDGPSTPQPTEIIQLANPNPAYPTLPFP